jgi:hypothetical protein
MVVRRRFAARLAGRQQDAADDRLAALQLGLHLGDFFEQVRVALNSACASSRPGSPTGSPAACPVRGPRRRRAGPCARCALPRRRAGAGRPAGPPWRAGFADAGDEHDQQRRVEHEAQQHALHVQAGDAARVVERQRQRLGEDRQPARQASVMTTMVQVDQASSSTADRITCSRYRKAKGLVVPPDRYSWMVRLATSTSKARNSSLLVTGRCSCQRRWLAMLKAIRQASTSSICTSGRLHVEHQDRAGDGRDLADHGDPAQLDQLQHVLVAGGVFDVGSARRRASAGPLFLPVRSSFLPGSHALVGAAARSHHQAPAPSGPEHTR